MWHLPATTVAGHGLAWPDAGGRWLPFWLPRFVSTANLQRTRTEARNSPLLPARMAHGQRSRTARPMPATMPSAASAPNQAEDTPTQHRSVCARFQPPAGDCRDEDRSESITGWGTWPGSAPSRPVTTRGSTLAAYEPAAASRRGAHTPRPHRHLVPGDMNGEVDVRPLTKDARSGAGHVDGHHVACPLQPGVLVDRPSLDDVGGDERVDEPVQRSPRRRVHLGGESDQAQPRAQRAASQLRRWSRAGRACLWPGRPAQHQRTRSPGTCLPRS
jgi:hypothetical protein